MQCGVLVTGGAGFFELAVVGHLIADTDADVLNVDTLNKQPRVSGIWF